MVDAAGVAARTGARSVIVRRMARGALRVALAGKHGATGVARSTRLDLRGVEVVWRVATGAGGMTDGPRGLGDAQRWRLLRMAARAALIRGGAGLVDAMAVEAAARAGVQGLLLGVAFRARPGNE